MVSFPHFYQADPAYINAVDGLNPNQEEHETYLDLQPVRFLAFLQTAMSSEYVGAKFNWDCDTGVLLKCS